MLQIFFFSTKYNEFITHNFIIFFVSFLCKIFCLYKLFRLFYTKTTYKYFGYNFLNFFIRNFLVFFLFMSVHVFRYSPTFASTLDRSVLMAWA